MWFETAFSLVFRFGICLQLSQALLSPHPSKLFFTRASSESSFHCKGELPCLNKVLTTEKISVKIKYFSERYFSFLILHYYHAPRWKWGCSGWKWNETVLSTGKFLNGTHSSCTSEFVLFHLPINPSSFFNFEIRPNYTISSLSVQKFIFQFPDIVKLMFSSGTIVLKNIECNRSKHMGVGSNPCVRWCNARLLSQVKRQHTKEILELPLGPLG